MVWTRLYATVEAQLTGKAKQLEEEHMKGMSEAERLREVRISAAHV